MFRLSEYHVFGRIQEDVLSLSQVSEEHPHRAHVGVCRCVLELPLDETEPVRVQMLPGYILNVLDLPCLQIRQEVEYAPAALFANVSETPS